jgi:hypothetical protein
MHTFKYTLSLALLTHIILAQASPIAPTTQTRPSTPQLYYGYGLGIGIGQTLSLFSTSTESNPRYNNDAL